MMSSFDFKCLTIYKSFGVTPKTFAIFNKFSGVDDDLPVSILLMFAIPISTNSAKKSYV